RTLCGVRRLALGTARLVGSHPSTPRTSTAPESPEFGSAIVSRVSSLTHPFDCAVHECPRTLKIGDTDTDPRLRIRRLFLALSWQATRVSSGPETAVAGSS